MYIKHNDARICLSCGAVHDKKYDQVYGTWVCPACGKKDCVSLPVYIRAKGGLEEVHCGQY